MNIIKSWHFDAVGPSEKLQKIFLTGIALKSIEKRNERGMDDHSIMKTSGKSLMCMKKDCRDRVMAVLTLMTSLPVTQMCKKYREKH